ncbi:MAG: hypothetical protein VW600_02430 [Ferrovibrio sp.]
MAGLLTRFAALAILLLSLGLVACATQKPAPLQRERLPSGDPPIAEGRGRIYFYRTALSLGGSNSILGTPEQPLVLLDDTKVAEGLPGAVFYCDLLPGRHAVLVHGKKSYPLAVDLPANVMVYVRMDWGFGSLFGQSPVQEVPPPTGLVEIDGRGRIAAACPA